MLYNETMPGLKYLAKELVWEALSSQPLDPPNFAPARYSAYFACKVPESVEALIEEAMTLSNNWASLVSEVSKELVKEAEMLSPQRARILHKAVKFHLEKWAEVLKISLALRRCIDEGISLVNILSLVTSSYYPLLFEGREAERRATDVASGIHLQPLYHYTTLRTVKKCKELLEELGCL